VGEAGKQSRRYQSGERRHSADGTDENVKKSLAPRKTRRRSAKVYR
jgi:hypothetical protein